MKQDFFSYYGLALQGLSWGEHVEDCEPFVACWQPVEAHTVPWCLPGSRHWLLSKVGHIYCGNCRWGPRRHGEDTRHTENVCSSRLQTAGSDLSHRGCSPQPHTSPGKPRSHSDRLEINIHSHSDQLETNIRGIHSPSGWLEINITGYTPCTMPCN